MKRIAMLAMTAVLLTTATASAATGPGMIETFQNAPGARWRFFTDSVMGGVSTGRVEFLSCGTTRFARLTGTVSTDNNGGFIQIRMVLPVAPPGTRGVRLVARGNGQRYFIHLRTRGTILPWQYYQAGFDTGRDWRDIRLPLARFSPSGRLSRATPPAGALESIAVVAFGRDHAVEVEIREIGFY